MLGISRLVGQTQAMVELNRRGFRVHSSAGWELRLSTSTGELSLAARGAASVVEHFDVAEDTGIAC